MEMRVQKKVGDNNKAKDGQQRESEMTGWQPQHIISGGWVGHHPRGESEEQAAEWTRKYGQAYNDTLLPVYCPRRYGNMVKVRARSTNELTRISFELAKILKKQGGSTPAT